MRTLVLFLVCFVSVRFRVVLFEQEFSICSSLSHFPYAKGRKELHEVLGNPPLLYSTIWLIRNVLMT